ncbi:MAG: D-glycero-D-manno-heptose 1,7-bisphosphate phosphatase, partial [Candidatus Marinamargulisbacteria bacterium]
MKAIFLDRDGTLIEEKHFSHKPEDIELEKNVVPALKTLLSNNYHLFMITNQSGIGRGIFKVHHFL